MANYEFVTIWRLPAGVEPVWNEIWDVMKWPEWWRGVVSVQEIEKGGPDGVGSLRRFTWKSALPYQLTLDMRTTRVVRHERIEGTASGELSGTGIWTFAAEGGLTIARYDWKVEANKAWMRVLSPVARPLFAWNHDVVMRWGEEGIRLRLGNSTSAAQVAARRK